MHEWLFANQATWSEAADAADQFRKQAVALGADGAKYDACLTDPATEARIQRDVQDGMSAGVQGTPAFLINDWFLSGAYPFAEFQKLIEKAKQGLHPAPTPTPLPQGIDFFEVDPNRAGLTYDGSPTQGKADAGLVLLSFEDYKSAGAAEHATSVEPALKTKYVDTGQMRLVVKPLADTAPRAAVAAVCAARQGKFWEFRSLLYQKQAEWTEGDDAAMSGYAKSLGLDQAAFDACLKDATGPERGGLRHGLRPGDRRPDGAIVPRAEDRRERQGREQRRAAGRADVGADRAGDPEVAGAAGPHPRRHRAGEAGQPPGGRGCGRELLSRRPERADQAR